MTYISPSFLLAGTNFEQMEYLVLIKHQKAYSLEKDALGLSVEKLLSSFCFG